ncbi:MAG: GNAT family N-acetyltransferase [candidate division Zixibacteria bacterium]|nr:GNAT family N-acetyltransferase [candidate division Zixibacteria bacterium]
MPEIDYKIITARENSNLLDIADEVTLGSWPEFMLNDSVCNKYWSDLYRSFPEFQFILSEKDTGKTISVGCGIPLYWNGDFRDLPDEGLDWVLEKGFIDQKENVTPNILSALAITIAPEYRRRGFSYIALKTMTTIAKSHGLTDMIAPVRPSLKSQYPLNSIDKYIDWQNKNNQPFDPWIATHVKMGAELIKVCHSSMKITGTVGDWESWAKMSFPESGSYIVPGALVPVQIDHEHDTGTYIEPNVWMKHPFNMLNERQ